MSSMLRSLAASGGQVVEMGMNVAKGGANKMIMTALEEVVETVLEQAGPMCGKEAVEQIKKKRKVPDKAAEAAEEGAVAGIASCKDEIMEFVKTAARALI